MYTDMHSINVSSCRDNKKYPLLCGINSPADLRKLPLESLPQVCQELRTFIIEACADNPGHFASSMGAVDIIVALHYVFDTPTDHIVYDVGHQAYAHKILTGRREAFADQRKEGGISGFPTPLESEYDTFIAGHAGNSISAALGMAMADVLTPGHENVKTVALIGDASIGNGLAFEGLNNVANNPNDLLIILNDNEMSIDNNVGALHQYLSTLTTSTGYNDLRHKIYNAFRKKGWIGNDGKGRLLRLNNSLKAFISSQQNIFEGLNIRYFGPFDGHDVIRLVKTLRDIKEMKGPRLLHLNTVKGKGYRRAEENPTTWHAPGKFDPATGTRAASASSLPTPPRWQDVFGETLVELATDNPDIVGITAAMPSGTSMSKMLAAFPTRTFDVGISEGHAVTFAGGLAAAGKRPFVAIYSSFLQRAYDNIIHDAAIQGLPVTFCIDRAGVVGEDGVTHHGLFDFAYLGVIPGLAVASPADEETLRNLMYTASRLQGPMAIRYPRGNSLNTEWHTPFHDLIPGQGREIHRAPDSRVAILTIGPALEDARKAADTLSSEGISADIYDMIWLKPLDETLLADIASRYEAIVTVEDGSLINGFGQAVSTWMQNRTLSGLPSPKVVTLGVPDRWLAHASVESLKHQCGYDAEGIAKSVRSLAN